MSVQVLVPFANVYASPKPMAVRPVSVAGLRPGILENSKPNAQMLMEAWIEGLRLREPLGTLTIGHKNPSGPASSHTLDLMQESCDFVLVGTGDCGSCLAWTVRTAIALEERGVPTVCVGSSVFEEQFRLEAANSSMPDLKCVFAEHPIGGVPAAAIRAKAAKTLGSIHAALCATPVQ